MMSHGSGSNANLWCGKPDVRAAFAELGITLLCTSSAIIDGDKRWRPPSEGSSVNNPYPCTEEDSIDLPYFERILNWIDSQPSKYDNQRIFNGGFSQGSNYISYVSFCFPERLRGMVTSGSGLKVNGLAVEYCSEYDTVNRGTCEIGVTDGWRNTGGTGECDDCLFTPMKPVDGATDVVGQPLRACINVGELDSRVHGSDQYRYYFEKAGLRVDFVIWPGVRHDMPPDWPRVYNECLGINASANPVPTDAPVEPTDAPIQPSDAPVDPTEAPNNPPIDAPVVPSDAPVDPTNTEIPTNAVIPFVRRDDDGNAICEDLPKSVRFNVVFGEDDRDADEEDDKKFRFCESMKGFNIRQSESWCNRDARIRNAVGYEEELPKGVYVKVYDLCPKSCRACADTCADFNQAFTVEGAEPVNRRCPYLDKRPANTRARLCRNKIAQLKRGRVKQKPLTEQCAKTCGLVGEGKCANFLLDASE